MAKITPDLLLKAYSAGIFPMAESKNTPNISFFDPDPRGIIPLDAFHIPRKLKKLVLQRRFHVSYNKAFPDILAGCARVTEKRKDTWINDEIKQLYTKLFYQGNCHSVEVWLEGQLAGGLYGVSVGGAFFGESMYTIYQNASKVGLVHLVAALQKGGFSLLDSQFVNDHLYQFGAVEISRCQYRKALEDAIEKATIFPPADDFDHVLELVQSNTQRS